MQKFYTHSKADHDRIDWKMMWSSVYYYYIRMYICIATIPDFSTSPAALAEASVS